MVVSDTTTDRGFSDFSVRFWSSRPLLSPQRPTLPRFSTPLRHLCQKTWLNFS
uniref:Uncharacterized protein n=1 Tax=Takifugu rubripes TaxID=31033 RepID=A0A674NYX4_TAKRU